MWVSKRAHVLELAANARFRLVAVNRSLGDVFESDFMASNGVYGLCGPLNKGCCTSLLLTFDDAERALCNVLSYKILSKLGRCKHSCRHGGKKTRAVKRQNRRDKVRI